MHWSNVKLIFLREVRDQLRDRRTLFLIAVLPLLLYPLLGISMMQLSQFLTAHPSKILLVGLNQPAGLPPLVDKDRFAPQWFEDPQKGALLELEFKPALELPPDVARTGADTVESKARAWMQAKGYDVVVYFPPDFTQRLEQFRRDLHKGHEQPGGRETTEVPAPQLFYNSVKEKSEVAHVRVANAIRYWQDAIGRQNLQESNVPVQAAQPFDVQGKDVSEPVQRQAAIWSKILPLVLLIWALTGAFYPAIDLCAGEKERGTLETLLSSPAQRSEIVAGKLLTVMLFSMATSLLNLASLAGTGLLVMQRITALETIVPLGMPPLSTWPWLLLALVPVSALFSALCLALAVFARSTKEGQYYLMPLVLITLPLLILPTSPGVELTLGNSLIPLTGLMLLLRTLLEGNGWQALPFVLPVTLVTGACCWIALRWAIDQFNSESVLFRESERLDLRLWLRHLVRDRRETPAVAAAVACGLLILVLRFFMSLTALEPTRFSESAWQIIVSQLALVVPALGMTWLLTRNPAKTLLLRRAKWTTLGAALLLAVAVNPLYSALQWLLGTLYPMPPAEIEVLQRFEAILRTGPAWLVLLLIGLLPPLCEELTFRGFILSGLRHSGHKWRAILLSALFFAAAHPIVQQSLGAMLLGTLIAFLAVQTGSLWPGLLFHAAHNGLAWTVGQAFGSPESLFKEHPNLCWAALLGGALLTMAMLVWFSRLSYARTEEEQLSETIAEEAAGGARAEDAGAPAEEGRVGWQSRGK